MLKRFSSFKHGIHPPQLKLTAGEPIRRVPFAPSLILPLSQHIGSPARAVVHQGQEVNRGDLIAEAVGFVSVPYHAPAGGVIQKVGLVPGASGHMVEGIYLKPHPGLGQANLEREGLDPNEATASQIVDAVRNSGMTGMGGAGFPTHVKYRIPEGKSVDTLIINGAECEPWLTADHRMMLERADDLFMGIRYVMKAVGARQAIIGVEANKLDAVACLERSRPGNLPVAITPVKVKYPQGAEKMLIHALLARDVPAGKLPVDVKVVVSNVATIAELGYLLSKGLGLVERVMTISGSAVKRPGNYVVPIGTPLRFLMEHVGMRDDLSSVLLGGPMMGQAVANLDVAVTKGTSGIVALTSRETNKLPTRAMPCIRCGYCVEVCPMMLNPTQLGRLAAFAGYKRMRDEFHLYDCFECGSCSYICPSSIPLVQQFRAAKAVLRDQKEKVVV